MRRLPRLVCLVALFIAAAAAAALAAPFAYVTNSGSASVSVVDVATNTVAGTVAVRGVPGAVAINANATRVYVASHSTGLPNPNVIFVIDTVTRTVVAEIVLPFNSPTGLALSADGSRLFVTHFLSSGSTLTAINTATNTVIGSIPAGRFAAGVVAHPAGGKLYVASLSNVVVVDPATLAVLGVITAGSRPYGLAINKEGTTLYVGNNGGSSVSVVNTATGLVTGEVFTGNVPFALSLNPDGTRLFVGNQSSKTLSIVNTATLTELMEISLNGATPYGVQSGPDGTKVYVADFFGGKLLVVDVTTGTIVNQISVGDFPIAFGEFIRSTSVNTNLAAGGVNPSEVVLGSSSAVAVRAVLSRADNGAAVAGATVEFLLGGSVVGSGVTGADGAAGVNFNPSALGVGLYSFSARFGGGTISGVTYGESSGLAGTLRVVYKFSGFLPPLKAGVNDQKAGSMVNAKWQLSNAAGAAIGDMSVVQSVMFGTAPCGGTPSSWSNATGTLSYDSVENMFMFQWKTPQSLSGQCVRLALTLNDGTVHSVDFSFR